MRDPYPKERVFRPKRFEWHDRQRIKLSLSKTVEFDPLNQIIDRRRTQRSFGQLDESKRDALLWYTSRTILSEVDCNGLAVQHRPVPSAGALHPIHLLVHTPENQCFRYIPEEHSLALCSSVFIDSKTIRSCANKLVSGGEGVLIQLIAEPAITHSKYHNADSLVYRDAGVILGHLSVVSEGLMLNFCALGITGDSWLNESNSNGQLAGVGLAWVGSRLP